MANLDAGDEWHKNGDYITFDVIADDIPEGSPVAVDGNGNIVAATEGDSLIGVLYREPHGTANVGTVMCRGAVKALVDESAAFGESLGSPGVAGGEADNVLGHGDDQSYLVLSEPVDEGDGTFTAKVLIR